MEDEGRRGMHGRKREWPINAQTAQAVRLDMAKGSKTGSRVTKETRGLGTESERCHVLPISFPLDS